MADLPPQDPRRRGANLVMLLALFALIAALAAWAYDRNPWAAPPVAPEPQAAPGGGNSAGS